MTKTRNSRDELIQLADNAPKWKYSGGTENICELAQDLFNFNYGTKNREKRIYLLGGSGKNDKYIIYI